MDSPASTGSPYDSHPPSGYGPIAVMLFEEKEGHWDHLDLLVRLEWLPGVFVEIESREGADLAELRALVGSLRPVEESDAVVLAAEVTGGPRR